MLESVTPEAFRREPGAQGRGRHGGRRGRSRRLRVDTVTSDNTPSPADIAARRPFSTGRPRNLPQAAIRFRADARWSTAMGQKTFFLLLLLGPWGAGGTPAGAEQPKAPARPLNVVFLLADDLR